ncbi:hypothetical protein WT13_23410 [Burkholderia anthina]|nr:hypothetical protein WT13_23410 [Burkholderia anthina]
MFRRAISEVSRIFLPLGFADDANSSFEGLSFVVARISRTKAGLLFIFHSEVNDVSCRSFREVFLRQ